MDQLAISCQTKDMTKRMGMSAMTAMMTETKRFLAELIAGVMVSSQRNAGPRSSVSTLAAP